LDSLYLRIAKYIEKNLYPNNENNDENKEKIEVIFALNPSLEGDATSMYIRSELVEKFGESNFNFSKLAMGISKGADIEYLDNETLKNAIGKREKMVISTQ
jgi:recombination protein RecR